MNAGNFCISREGSQLNNQKEKWMELSKRYIVFVMGLFILAFGVALSTKADLGTSPISCIPYILSIKLSWTMGEFTILMHIVFILLQIILLREKYQLIQLLQLPVAFLFGYFTDITIRMVHGLNPNTYLLQWLVCIASFFAVGLGVFLEVKANVVMLAGEGLICAIAQVRKKEFGITKIWFDSILVLLGIVLSFLLLHQLKGIREGTIAAALLVGIIVRFYEKKITCLDRFFVKKENSV